MSAVSPCKFSLSQPPPLPRGERGASSFSHSGAPGCGCPILRVLPQGGGRRVLLPSGATGCSPASAVRTHRPPVQPERLIDSSRGQVPRLRHAAHGHVTPVPFDPERVAQSRTFAGCHWLLAGQCRPRAPVSAGFLRQPIRVSHNLRTGQRVDVSAMVEPKATAMRESRIRKSAFRTCSDEVPTKSGMRSEFKEIVRHPMR